MRPRKAIRVGRATVLAAVFALASATGAFAHVNRTVGPYTFLIVLIEEPYFTSNHAGFEFWVHKGDAPVAGLDRTLHAQAIGHGRTVDLLVSPCDKDQLYPVDRSVDGDAFDPMGGGIWSLRLTGTIEGTPVDETFAVEFPAYPRVGDTSPASSTAATAGDAELVPPYLVLLLIGIGGLFGLREIRRHGVGVPSLAFWSEGDGQSLETSIGRRP